VKGRVRRQERPDEVLQFRLIWGAPIGQSAAWCARVETRPRDRATTGVVREAVEAEGGDPQPAAGLCSAAQRDLVRTRCCRLHGQSRSVS